MLLVGLLAAALLVVGGVVGFAGGQFWSAATGADDTGSMMGTREGEGMGSMMDGGSMMGSQMRGSLDEEGKPFDLQFIDQMIPHHEGALMSSKHMISNSKRPEMRQLYENIQKSQYEQIEQMQEWRKEWYPDAEQPSGMMGEGQTGSMMGNGMMQDMMGADATDSMFLRMMIPHHQMAVDMSKQAHDKAEHPELKELAQTILDEQSAEIEQMRGDLEEIDSTNGI